MKCPNCRLSKKVGFTEEKLGTRKHSATLYTYKCPNVKCGVEYSREDEESLREFLK